MSLTECTQSGVAAGLPRYTETIAQAGRAEFRQSLRLRHGGLRELRIACEWQGPSWAPTIVVAGGISAHRHVASSQACPEAGWWEAQVGPGKTLDSARHRIVAIDWLGGDGALDCAIDSSDQAQAIAAVLDRLGVARVAAFVGCSYGAMVGLQFAALYPERLQRLVAISGGDRPHPYASAWRELQRRIVQLGCSEGGRREALSLARQLAMLSYRTPEEFAERFDAPVALVDGRARCASTDYLEACGERYVARTSTTAFLRLSESIDLHAVDAAAISVPVELVAVDEDRLVPLSTLKSLAARLGPRCRLQRLRSRHGHDAFLTEPEQIAATLAVALQGVAA
jgi:homoserine O-acetyltransferase